MNSVVTLIAAEGIPAAVFAAKLHRAAANCRGGARFTRALACTGPGGMLGGLITLAAIQAASYIITDVATEQALLADVRHKVKKGLPLDRIAEAIDRYPVSFGLKEKLKKRAAALYKKELRFEAENTIRLIQNGGPKPKRKEVSE